MVSPRKGGRYLDAGAGEGQLELGEAEVAHEHGVVPAVALGAVSTSATVRAKKKDHSK
jgi:hypothetical protein